MMSTISGATANTNSDIVQLNNIQYNTVTTLLSPDILFLFVYIKLWKKCSLEIAQICMDLDQANDTYGSDQIWIINLTV